MPAPNDLVVIPLASATLEKAITFKPSEFRMAYDQISNVGGSAFYVVKIITAASSVALDFELGSSAETNAAVADIYAAVDAYYTAINA